jgi:hypothetical protein
MSADTELERVSYLWSGTERFELHRHVYKRTMLKVVFADGKASIGDIFALRKLFQRYRSLSLQEARHQIGNTAPLELGIFDSIMAEELVVRGREMGLKLVSSDASWVGYMPVHAATGVEIVIPEDELVKKVVEKMMVAGVLIIEDV